MPDPLIHPILPQSNRYVAPSAPLLVDVARAEREYFGRKPDVTDSAQLVRFGASGHRGSPLRGSFNEAHVAAIAQAICEYRCCRGIDGPLFLGRDTQALSESAQRTALEVLAANEVQTRIQRAGGATPAPAISKAIVDFNRGRDAHLADGIVVSPSHNPPGDGGFKYDPPHGGPADVDATAWIEDRANELLRAGGAGVRRTAFPSARTDTRTQETDFLLPYVRDLHNVVDVEAIRAAGVELAVDPRGGASSSYWQAIGAIHRLPIAIANHGRFHVGVINDASADRYEIVTRSARPLDANGYLAVAVDYLLTHRARWAPYVSVGKTVVTSGLVDRVAKLHRRQVYEVPVGFKWFVPFLSDGSCAFAGEESAGATFARRDGRLWTTDKDGLVMGLLAAEITARTGSDPGEHYRALDAELGPSYFARIEAPASPQQKARLKLLSPAAIRERTLAGDPITATLTRARGNQAPIDGLKVTTPNGWFAARPSGTDDACKIYAESFRSAAHLEALVKEAKLLVKRAIGGTE